MRVKKAQEMRFGRGNLARAAAALAAGDLRGALAALACHAKNRQRAARSK